MRRDGDSAVVLRWVDDRPTDSPVFAIVPRDTSSFGPGGQAFMVNVGVRDLD
jgi:hypothetical protein